jgi:crossover junction endodeoxyribonuclease RuvC
LAVRSWQDGPHTSSAHREAKAANCQLTIMPPKIHTLPRELSAPAGAHSSQRRMDRLEAATSGLPPARLILGVDPGLHRTGYGVIDLGESRSSSRAPRMVEAGVLRARAADPFPLRLQTLHGGLREVLEETRPDIVVIEDLFATYAHPRSALLMAHARGVLMLAAQQAGVLVHHFTPNEVKQVVAGGGHASKATVQAAVKARLKLAAAPEPPDVADALALALCFAMRQRL